MLQSRLDVCSELILVSSHQLACSSLINISLFINIAQNLFFRVLISVDGKLTNIFELSMAVVGEACTPDCARRQFISSRFAFENSELKINFQFFFAKRQQQQKSSSDCLSFITSSLFRDSEKPQSKFPPRRYRAERLLTATPIDSDREASFPTRLARLETLSHERLLTSIVGATFFLASNPREDVPMCLEIIHSVTSILNPLLCA